MAALPDAVRLTGDAHRLWQRPGHRDDAGHGQDALQQRPARLLDKALLIDAGAIVDQGGQLRPGDQVPAQPARFDVEAGGRGGQLGDGGGQVFQGDFLLVSVGATE